MPKFFFDVEVFGLISHADTSDELTGLEAAVASANDCAMAIVAEDKSSGDGAGPGSVLVRDEDGQIVYRVNFVEAEAMSGAYAGKPH